MLKNTFDGLLKMVGSEENLPDKNTANDPNPTPNPNHDKAVGSSKSNDEEQKKRDALIAEHFRSFYKANSDFNKLTGVSPDKQVSTRDIYNDYGEYLPETDKTEFRRLMQVNFPDFRLNPDDTVHQFWLNKRESNLPG
ncbi:MAG: hypothetical protein EOP34_04380 [Rickettsiales bacterium]|nr:MAG: hypothetical protein EOP34_04380 [Rickettsiales bacterium]